MATVKNSVATAKQNPMDKKVTFDVNGRSVELSPNIIKRYLVSGGQITDQEAVAFLNLCKFAGLNPWLHEAYCIKFGSDPATMVTGKEAFLKRAEAHPAYDGAKAGVIVEAEDGELIYREGSFTRKEETLVGGWAEVFRKDKNHSMREEVSFDEYAVRKKDGSLNSQWSKKPATMIRKVALVQALRESFPAYFGGMYTSEEVGVEEPAAMDIGTQAEVIPDADGVVAVPNEQEVKPQMGEYVPYTEDDLPYDNSLL